MKPPTLSLRSSGVSLFILAIFLKHFKQNGKLHPVNLIFAAFRLLMTMDMMEK
jgi:hypothetical protein